MEAPPPALFSSPFLDLPVVPRKQNIRHAPPAKLGWPSVVRILEPTLQLGGEALEGTRLLANRAREAACDRVDEHHRRKVAVGEHVRADGDRVGGEMLHDALVEALEACRQQRQ